MSRSTWGGAWRLAAVLALSYASLSIGERASAAPPPPNFWDFRISNLTGQDVVNVEVLLYAHAEGHPDQINTNAPVRLTFTKVAPGSTTTLGLAPIFGIAKIDATAECPAPRRASLSITAQRQDFDGQPTTQEYAGFCPQGPGETFPTVLEFYEAEGQIRAKLQGKSRWGAYYDATPKSDDKTFQ